MQLFVVTTRPWESEPGMHTSQLFIQTHPILHVGIHIHMQRHPHKTTHSFPSTHAFYCFSSCICKT